MNNLEEARSKALENFGEENNLPDGGGAPEGETLPQESGMAGAQVPAGEPQGNENPEGNPTPNENQPPATQQDVITEQAVQAAERATAQMQTMQGQMQLLVEQNQQLQQTIEQMSEQHQESVVNRANEAQMPTIDFNALMLDDDETRAAKQNEFTQNMVEYLKSSLMSELNPVIAESKAGLEAKEFENALLNMANTEGFEKAVELRPQLEQIIKNNSLIANSDATIEDKLLEAYVIARGIDAIQNPVKELTADELFAKYKENDDFRRLVDKERLTAVRNQPSVPPLSAGGGAGNAALHIPEKPKTMQEAKELAKKKFMV